MSHDMTTLRRPQIALLGALCLTFSACQSPVVAMRVDPTVAHRDLTRSALTTGEPSWPTRDALAERGFVEAYRERPEAALADLHQAMLSSQDPNLLFALSELSVLYGQKTAKAEYMLAAAVYAYAFLFPEAIDLRPGPFDPRFRMAADVYNWALAGAFASEDGSEVVPRGGTFALPFGQIEVSFDPEELRAGSRELEHFIPVAELEVQGLAIRYRMPGVGTPLAASLKAVEAGTAGSDLMAPRLKVPLTALLRIEHPRRALVTQAPLHAVLELHLAWEDDAVSVAGESVPLEREPTAALALTFTDVPILDLEIFGFLGRLSALVAARPPLVSTSPYQPGLLPVVFVHGTASSVVRWAELYNRLQGDPEIRSRFQFWFFQYDSNEPIALSALHLRDALTSALAKLDPTGADPALRRMVLIGHSQGGLLAKMQSIESGDRIWNAVSKKPLAELRLSDETRALMQRGLFVEPLPEVARVVFISTPHRGSFLAGRPSIVNLLRWLTVLPLQLASVSADLARNQDSLGRATVPTAVDNMSPKNPFIQGLQSVPVAPTIAAHSIISVKGTGPFEDGDDGVVEYRSAHIEGVESEVVVRSPHSCQGKPETMEEVRRILRLHAGVPPGGALEAPPEAAGP
jgi:pimeloyl-ACP methyl ester carboxylesterase